LEKAPAHTSIRYALQGLDAAEVEKAFRQHAAELNGEPAPGAVVALDGKTLRGSFDPFKDREAAQVLSALATETSLVLGHVTITHQDGDKHHEIQAAQHLIETLGLSGRLLTFDALHMQKKTVETVIASGNHILVQLKGNQPSLQACMLCYVPR
jgi:hypothetical protein